MKIGKFLIHKYFGNVFTKDSPNNPTRERNSTNLRKKIEKKEEKINEKLLKIKELKYFHDLVGIEPVYFLYFVLCCLILLVVGYLENLFTSLIGILYPLYCSIKALREKNKENIKNWLHYWIIFSFFINFESILSHYLNEIPLYFFYKVIFLMICYIPQYNGAKYFYKNFVRDVFIKYEKDVVEISSSIAQKIKTTLLDSDGDGTNSS